MNAFNEHLSRLLEWIYRVLSSSILCVENINLIEYTRHTYLSKYLSKVYTLGDSGDFQTSRYQGIVKATASGVFEDLKFKISEGSDQN